MEDPVVVSPRHAELLIKVAFAVKQVQSKIHKIQPATIVLYAGDWFEVDAALKNLEAFRSCVGCRNNWELRGDQHFAADPGGAGYTPCTAGEISRAR